MYFSIRLDWIARIALPTALALCWHVGIVTAQSTTEAGSTPLISWRADAPTSSEQTATLPQATTAPSAPSEIQDAHVAPAVHEATVAPKQPVDARRLTPPSRVAALPDNKLFTTSDALPFDLPNV
jgi:hypothetical protein